MNPLRRIRNHLHEMAGVVGINRRNLDYVYRDHTPGRFARLDDKLLTKELLSERGVAVPRTLGIIGSTANLKDLDHELDAHEELVLKPSRGAGGRGILVLRRELEGWVAPSGHHWTREAILHHTVEVLQGLHSLDEEPDSLLVEERIHPIDALREIHGEGLADLRIVLHRKSPVQAMWRLPTHASDGKANLHQGGVGVGIDIETGIGHAAVWRGRRIERHPDTGALLRGLETPQWKECLHQARLASLCVDDIEYLGVDLVLDAERGPLVLELNARPGLEIQVANRRAQALPVGALLTRRERASYLVAGVLLLIMGLSPLISGQMQRRWTDEAPSRVVSADGELEITGTSNSGLEWDDSETRVSELSNRFSEARAALAAEDTLEAFVLYEEAAQDSSIAPFARNNMALLLRRQGRHEEAEEQLRIAVEIYPDYARGHYNLGLVLEDRMKIDEAMERYARVLELRPSHSRSWGHQADIHRRWGEFEKALQGYQQAIRYDPGSRSHRMGRGRTLRSLDRPEEAVGAFAAALRLEPASTSALYWWGRSLLDTAPSDERRPTSLTALDDRLESESDREDARLRVVELSARLHYRRGELRHSVERLAMLRTRAYRPSFVTEASAWCALEAGRWDTSLELLDDLDDERSRSPLEQFAQLGRSLERVSRNSLDTMPELLAVPEYPTLEQRLADRGGAPGSLQMWLEWKRAWAEGDSIGAQSILEDLGREFPEFQPARRLRFDIAIDHGELEKASALAAMLLSEDPRDERVNLAMARSILTQGDPDRARGYLKALKKTTQNRPDVQLLHAEIEQARGRPRSALRFARRAARAAPQDFETQHALAKALVAAGKEAEAVDVYRQALDLQPDAPETREGLARTLQNLRRYAEAADEWQKLCRLDGESTSRLFNLSLSLQRSEQLAAAALSWDRCMAAGGARSYKVQFNRALALERLGRIEEAREGFLAVLRLQPDHAASRRHLDSFSNP